MQDNHSTTTAHSINDTLPILATSNNGAVPYVHANPIVFNPASPTTAQSAIIANAGLQSEYEDIDE